MTRQLTTAETITLNTVRAAANSRRAVTAADCVWAGLATVPRVDAQRRILRQLAALHLITDLGDGRYTD